MCWQYYISFVNTTSIIYTGDTPRPWLIMIHYRYECTCKFDSHCQHFIGSIHFGCVSSMFANHPLSLSMHSKDWSRSCRIVGTIPSDSPRLWFLMIHHPYTCYGKINFFCLNWIVSIQSRWSSSVIDNDLSLLLVPPKVSFDLSRLHR